MSSVITLSLLIWLVMVQTWGNDLGPLQWFEVSLMRSANSVNEEFSQEVPLFQSVIDRPWQARAEAKYFSFVSLFGSCGWKRPESTSAYQVHVTVGNSQTGEGSAYCSQADAPPLWQPVTLNRSGYWPHVDWWAVPQVRRERRLKDFRYLRGWWGSREVTKRAFLSRRWWCRVQSAARRLTWSTNRAMAFW